MTQRKSVMPNMVREEDLLMEEQEYMPPNPFVGVNKAKQPDNENLAWNYEMDESNSQTGLHNGGVEWRSKDYADEIWEFLVDLNSSSAMKLKYVDIVERIRCRIEGEEAATVYANDMEMYKETRREEHMTQAEEESAVNRGNIVSSTGNLTDGWKAGVDQLSGKQHSLEQSYGSEELRVHRKKPDSAIENVEPQANLGSGKHLSELKIAARSVPTMMAMPSTWGGVSTTVGLPLPWGGVSTTMGPPLPWGGVAAATSQPSHHEGVATTMSEPSPQEGMATTMSKPLPEECVATTMSKPLPEERVATTMSKPLPEERVATTGSKYLPGGDVSAAMPKPSPWKGVSSIKETEKKKLLGVSDAAVIMEDYKKRVLMITQHSPSETENGVVGGMAATGVTEACQVRGEWVSRNDRHHYRTGELFGKDHRGAIPQTEKSRGSINEGLEKRSKLQMSRNDLVKRDGMFGGVRAQISQEDKHLGLLGKVNKNRSRRISNLKKSASAWEFERNMPCGNIDQLKQMTLSKVVQFPFDGSGKHLHSLKGVDVRVVSTEDGRFYTAEVGGSIKEFPSVTTILANTLDDKRSDLLQFWELSQVKKHGRKKHEANVTSILNAGSLFHMNIEDRLRERVIQERKIAHREINSSTSRQTISPTGVSGMEEFSPNNFTSTEDFISEYPNHDGGAEPIDCGDSSYLWSGSKDNLNEQSAFSEVKMKAENKRYRKREPLVKMEAPSRNERASQNEDVSLLMLSVDHVLNDISDIRVLESKLIHLELGYSGTCDCVAKYRGRLCVIDWKTSRRKKATLRECYDYPLQLVAYSGAINHNPDIFDFKIRDVLLVIAYTDGSPADIHYVNHDMCLKLWPVWLSRLLKYQVMFRGMVG